MKLFEPPMILLKKGISKEYQITSAVNNSYTLFTDSLSAIKALEKDRGLLSLQVMSAIFNSKLFSYFALDTFSSVGIEREQVHNKEKWEIPYVFNPKISQNYLEVETLIEKLNKEENILNNQLDGIEIKNKIEALDASIFAEFNIVDAEKALIDYANNIIIPVQMQHTGFEKHFEPIRIDDPGIESYAQLFIDRFSPSLNTEKLQFIVEIWHSNQIIGMFFKVAPKKKNQKSIVWINKTKEKLLSTAIKLSSQKITDKLFVQKDFRGFEKEFFYIFKPNEKRLWHKAIGYQDVDEFMDAILKTNRRTYSGK